MRLAWAGVLSEASRLPPLRDGPRRHFRYLILPTSQESVQEEEATMLELHRHCAPPFPAWIFQVPWERGTTLIQEWPK